MARGAWMAAWLLAGPAVAQTYENPLPVAGAGGPAESCADPDVAPTGADGGAPWVMVCTTDPLNGDDRDANGDLVFHLVPMFTSDDLVTWRHAGDAFDRDPATDTPDPPAWADPTAVFWAPEFERIGDRWHLFFTVTDALEEFGGEPGCDEDSAIGHATAPSPLGPWTAAEAPIVAPRRAGEGCEFFWTIDPEAFEAADGRRFLFYGSFYGGIEGRELLAAEDGTLAAPAATAFPVTIPNRYEGAEVAVHDGFHYLFASATNCCNGPQTGYAAFVARSADPRGPYLDRDGASVLDAAVGGTPVIQQNGNGWVGAGHNTAFADAAGRWWTLYHAIEEADPWFEGETGFTARPVLLDPLDWVDGWPVVNGGRGPSIEPQPAPAARPGEPAAPPVPAAAAPAPPAFDPALSDEFDGAALGPAWSWVRGPAGAALAGGVLSVPTDAGDLHEDQNSAPVLLRPMPEGDFVVETRVRTDVPPEGCCYNYVQAGLVLRAGDDDYVKLVVVSIWETRQTEFAREVAPDSGLLPAGHPRYGNAVAGPPGEDWTWLRLRVTRGEGRDAIAAETSRDGEAWTPGGTWTHDLGGGAGIGLVAMGGAGFTAGFDYLRVGR